MIQVLQLVSTVVLILAAASGVILLARLSWLVTRLEERGAARLGETHSAD